MSQGYLSISHPIVRVDTWILDAGIQKHLTTLNENEFVVLFYSYADDLVFSDAY